MATRLKVRRPALAHRTLNSRSGIVEQSAEELDQADQQLNIVDSAAAQHGSKQGQSEQCTACPECQFLGTVSFSPRSLIAR